MFVMNLDVKEYQKICCLGNKNNFTERVTVTTIWWADL